MTKLLNRYYNIMERYQSGEFGEEHLTMAKILERGGAPKLLKEMSLSEIRCLIDKSYGMTKQMFSQIYSRTEKSVKRWSDLEKELADYNIGQYCNDKELSESVIAEKLRLEVKHFNADELPDDVEATLSPPSDKSFLGEIKILETDSNRFSFMHEIIHYLRDVGVGQTVRQEYTRKKQGKTDSVEEQEINYLTAAAVMPFEQIAADLKEFENLPEENNDVYLEKVAKKYAQAKDAVYRRFIEVRSLIDFGGVK